MRKNIKFKITEDKSQSKQAEYILPDLDLRKKFKKAGKAFTIGIMLTVFVYVVTFLTVLRAVSNEKLDSSVVGFVFIGFVVVMIAGGVITGIFQSKIIKKQLALLKENADKNALYIKLHELKTSFTKRWNILFGVLLVTEIISNILFAAVISLITKTSDYGWIFFLLFFVEMIAMFVVYFKSYAKVRQKMIVIENEIDNSVFMI